MGLGKILLGGLGGIGLASQLMGNKGGFNPLNALFGLSGLAFQPFGGGGGQEEEIDVTGLRDQSQGMPGVDMQGMGNMNFLGRLGGGGLNSISNPTFGRTGSMAPGSMTSLIPQGPGRRY